jgi:hypothetical protein
MAESGLLVAVWLQDESRKGLFFRKTYFDAYLESTGQCALLRRFVCKACHRNSGIGAQSDGHAYLQYDGALRTLYESIEAFL